MCKASFTSDFCCLPVQLMRTSSFAICQCCHPLSAICLAPSPLQEHFPSVCKMITGWLLDFLPFFTVYSPLPPSSHPVSSCFHFFSFNCSPAYPLNSSSPSPPQSFSFLSLLFWILFHASGQTRTEEGETYRRTSGAQTVMLLQKKGCYVMN